MRTFIFLFMLFISTQTFARGDIGFKTYIDDEDVQRKQRQEIISNTKNTSIGVTSIAEELKSIQMHLKTISKKLNTNTGTTTEDPYLAALRKQQQSLDSVVALLKKQNALLERLASQRE
tara:strand:- start:140 stop:496 length:357 start_codon:yes stop_codon:yes gene_type:complete